VPRTIEAVSTRFRETGRRDFEGARGHVILLSSSLKFERS
jgi:hypothetical protein